MSVKRSDLRRIGDIDARLACLEAALKWLNKSPIEADGLELRLITDRGGERDWTEVPIRPADAEDLLAKLLDGARLELRALGVEL